MGAVVEMRRWNRFTDQRIATVNCGQVMEINGFQVEVLSPEFSRHSANIVCHYFMENNIKVEVTYYKNPDGTCGHEVYFFIGKESSHHYYSNRYDVGDLPDKYTYLSEKLIKAHQEIF